MFCKLYIYQYIAKYVKLQPNTFDTCSSISVVDPKHLLLQERVSVDETKNCSRSGQTEGKLGGINTY